MDRISIAHVRRQAVGRMSLRHVDISGPDVDTLERSGCRVTETSGGRLELGTIDVLLVTGNAAWFPHLWRQLAGTPAHRRPLVVIRHDEPLPPPPESGLAPPRLTWREWMRILRRDPNATDCFTNARFLRRLARQSLPDLLVVSSIAQQEYLATCGIRSSWVPKGSRDSYGDDLGLPRTIDVLSLGDNLLPRRKRVIDGLRRQRIEVTTAGDYFDPSCYGDERTRLLNRSRILVNILRDPGLSMGQSRLTLGMCTRTLVVSEPLYRPEPFVAGRHYVSASVADMPEAIGYFLSHDEERAAITGEAYRHVREVVTEASATARIVELIREALAAHGRCRVPVGCPGPDHHPRTMP